MVLQPFLERTFDSFCLTTDCFYIRCRLDLIVHTNCLGNCRFWFRRSGVSWESKILSSSPDANAAGRRTSLRIARDRMIMSQGCDDQLCDTEPWLLCCSRLVNMWVTDPWEVSSESRWVHAILTPAHRALLILNQWHQHHMGWKLAPRFSLQVWTRIAILPVNPAMAS